MPCCISGSICFELIKGMPTAFVALVIGLVAAGIAWRQAQIAAAKLKIDLFEKRYQIFELTWGFLSHPLREEGPLPEFSNIIPQAEFLFGKNVADYLREASSKRTELWMINQKVKQSGNVMPPEDISRNTELSSWFANEATEGARRVFGPYLNFKSWR